VSVTVLRLGHRPQRDKRISTHVLLAARAFGADEAVYAGTRDPALEESVAEVVEDWGGGFTVRHTESWRGTVKAWRGEVVHLTMYGLPVQQVIQEIRASPEPKLVAVGGPKVPRELYDLATWNVSVTSQPHSEVSALAVFLHMLFGGEELEKSFEGARLRIKPRSRGKEFEALSKD
jgi:tRNA (cytidine56-2'-O)-methyltransferase